MLHRFGPGEIDGAAALLRAGGVLAYPTEAVFGLGCDPQDLAAFERLFALKQRPADQGVLLIAAELDQLERYLALDQLPEARQHIEVHLVARDSKPFRYGIIASWPLRPAPRAPLQASLPFRPEDFR